MKIEIVPTQTEESKSLVNISAGDVIVANPVGYDTEETIDISGIGKPKRGRPKKKKINGEEIITGEQDVSYLQTNTPYITSYQETDDMLKQAINQLDYVGASITEDIEAIRQSKTLRNKYSYISDLSGTLVNSIQGKITAVREINNSIKNAHELDLKRAKELKLGEQKDDTKTIMDMYQAFVSTPVSSNLTGPFQSPLGANTMDLTVPSPQLGITMMGQNPDNSYNNYVNNMTPEQLTMMIEENPDMKHVIAYDPSTGNADFAVYDQRTGQFLNGVPTRDKEMFMPGMQFDFNTMQAHSNDLNETYDVIYVGNAASPQEIITADNNSPSGVDMSNY